MRTKQERLLAFLERLAERPAAWDFETARQLLSDVLNEVEDQLSGVPNQLTAAATDGRMYPPLDDNMRSVQGFPEVKRFRNKGHNTFIRTNGAIRIEELPTKRVVLDKPGWDGRRAFDP
jgi:hypothetical protein